MFWGSRRGLEVGFLLASGCKVCQLRAEILTALENIEAFSFWPTGEQQASSSTPSWAEINASKQNEGTDFTPIMDLKGNSRDLK